MEEEKNNTQDLFKEEEKDKKEEVVEKSKEEIEREAIQEQKRMSRMMLIVLGAIALIFTVALVIFLVKRIKVTFDYEDGRKNKVVYVDYGGVVDKSKIDTDLGEDFIGWYLVTKDKSGKNIIATEPFNFNTKIMGDVYLVALYDENNDTVIVHFDTKGGSAVDSISLTKGSTLTLPEAPTKKGYTFVTWEDNDGVEIGEDTVIKRSTTLYAVWKKESTASDKEYYCEDGYTLSGTNCVMTDTVKATGSCPDGYRGASTSTVCKSEVDVSYKCPDYKKYKGSEGALDADSNICYYDANRTVKTDAVEYCPKGELEDGACVITVDKEFTCPDGYSLNGNKCIKKEVKAALVR